MAGFLVKIQDAVLQRRIDALQAGLADATPLMRIWGEIAQTSISENFEVGGRPDKWQALSDVTIALKGHARPLIGRTRNLSSIVVRPESQRVLVGTQPAAKDYAAIQQFGGKAGRGRKVKIPARPYLLLQDEDREEMADESRSYLRRIGT